MMAEQEKSQSPPPRDASRRIQEAGRSGQETIRAASDEAGRMAGVTADTLGVWMQVNERLMREFTELSTNAAQHGARMLIDIQRANMEALQELQSSRMRLISLWPSAFRDPVSYYQRVVEEGLNNLHRSFGLGQRNGETVARSLEQMQSVVQETTRGLQETFRVASTRLQEAVQRADRAAAA
jgi:hypothetical protein